MTIYIYIYVFHLSGTLLLIAIVGAISLILQNKKKGVKKQNVLKQLTQSSSIKIDKINNQLKRHTI